MTRILRAGLLAVAAFWSVGGAAFAQADEERERYIPTGSRIPRWEETRLEGYRDSVRILREFAACIIRRDPEGSRRLVDTLPESTAQVDAIAALIRPDESPCLAARRMRITAPLLRGAISEQFLLLQEPPFQFAASPTPVEEFADFSVRFEAADVDGVDTEDRALIVGSWLARCVAHERPDIIRGILATRSMSEAEQIALRAAEPAFSACLLEGQVLEVHQLTIRALLARELYLRAAPAPAAAAPAA